MHRLRMEIVSAFERSHRAVIEHAILPLITWDLWLSKLVAPELPAV